MPSQKTVTKYPKYYWKVFNKALEGAKDIICANENAAKATRRDMYNFREAIRGHDWAELGKATRYDSLCFSIRDNRLVIHRQDYNGELL